MELKPLIGEMVRVRWLDCRLFPGPSYDYEVPAPIEGADVGWLVRESETDVAVALERFEKAERELHTYRNISVIPKCQVLSIEKLQVVP